MQNQHRPDFGSERQAIRRGSGKDLFQQVSSLLQDYAPNFEPKSDLKNP
ncbi:hypothetical protein MC7420_7453 [Coleofasciculus chthonoplastes PCC 7420]|uniref:Uncharacterized protein n=2 Tax=Coleofasciculaceae TaxID=1892251 RepID=B4VHL7_9CYAN|nr:hypothetical protein MC7420_7453 [Coleofasciculus chthonoplastes PCC 7420]